MTGGAYEYVDNNGNTQYATATGLSVLTNSNGPNVGDAYENPVPAPVICNGYDIATGYTNNSAYQGYCFTYMGISHGWTGVPSNIPAVVFSPVSLVPDATSGRKRVESCNGCVSCGNIETLDQTSL